MSDCVTGHSAYITDRGGSRRVGQLVDLSRVAWDRRRDDISEGSLIVQGGACARQAPLLRNIEPRRNELVIYRGDERVWEGPVDRVGWHSNHVEVIAKDVTNYLQNRPLSKTWDNSYSRLPGATPAPGDDIIVDRTAPVTTRMGDIITYELANPFTMVGQGGNIVMPAWEGITPPINVLPHLVVHHFPGEARTSAKTYPFQYTVGEHMDNFARTAGLDYTTIGRAIHLWDTSNPLVSGRMLTEADFYGEIIVTAYGADYASGAITSAHDGTYGAAGKNDPYYGPWTKIFTVYDEEDDDVPGKEELNSQASRNLSGRNPVPIEVRVPDNSSIRLSTGFDIENLVPGTYFPLLATLNSRQVSQVQKLHTVSVIETSEGETVQVNLVPASRADEEGEE